MAKRFVHLADVKRNMSLFKTMQEGDFFTYKGSRLSLGHNRLLHFFQKRKIKEIIHKTFLTFCHEIKNPLEREELRLTYRRTKEIAEKALHQIANSRYKFLLPTLKNIFHNYEKATLLQEKILKSLDRAIALTSPKKEFFLQEAIEGLALGKEPKRAQLGASGVYMIPGKSLRIAAVFKPFDEEISGPNNPNERRYRGTFGRRTGTFSTLVGTGVFREVAASLVDRRVGLGLVPHTCFAKLCHPCFYSTYEGQYIKEEKCKRGSLQEFKAGYKHLAELSSRGLEGIPLDQLHRLVILDAIIGNADRNQANILTNGRKLCAIDHALSFGLHLKQNNSDHLFKLPQLNLPFSDYLKKKVENIDMNTLAGLLRKRCFLDARELHAMKKRLLLLRNSMRQNLTPHQVLKSLFPRS